MPYQTSESIKEISAALAAAQRLMEGAAKDSSNPFFKSTYADLASVWLAIREPLGANGLAVMQLPSADGPKVIITTLLSHSSGEWISSELTITAKEDTPQAVGSAITYARRYALQSIAGVAPEDDDGERAQGRNTPTVKQPQKAPPRQAPSREEEVINLKDSINTATSALLKKFKDIGQEKEFYGTLGAYGYVDVSEIPLDYKPASAVIEALKLKLADLKKSVHA